MCLLCVREPAFDISDAKKFELYWDLISAVFLSPAEGQGVTVEVVQKPSKELYNSLRKSDPFLSRTESMFS